MAWWLDFSPRSTQAYGGITARARIGTTAVAAAVSATTPNRLWRAETRRDQEVQAPYNRLVASKNLRVKKR